MMCAVEELDLTAIGALIEFPEAVPLRSGLSEDRLGGFARWWVGVAGTAAPRRVEQLWQSHPGGPSGAAGTRADVVLREFDAPDDVAEALSWGISVANDSADDGTDLILLSVPPSGPDDIDWYVLVGQLLGLDAVEAIGWPHGAGLDDQDWIVTVGHVRDGLRRTRGLREHPQKLLAALGSRPLAAATGVLLQAAARRTPALLDGPAAAACALLVSRIAGAGSNWWQAADLGGAVLNERVLEELRIEPLTRLGLWDEDGTAARIGLTLLETALARRLAQADEQTAQLQVELDDDEQML
jgi:NaMN:DMB phosphoribosyltransferase